jgi:hypothetical protein
MLMVPDWISSEMAEQAIAKAGEKEVPKSLGKVRLETLEEGLCVQILHIGSFDDEAEVLKEMHERFIPEQGLKMVRKHHEIYLSDFRKVAPEKLRTILRQPVEGA